MHRPKLFDIAAHVLLDAACGSRCAGCGQPGRGSICGACRAELDAIRRPRDAAFHDTGAVARMVRQAKHGHWRGGARELSVLLVERAAIPPVELVTWVPADARRRARRGGCLPERLARWTARRLGVPSVPLLERPTPGSQRGLDRSARRMSAASSYRALRSTRRPVQPGTRVLVLDDVRTTGATLAACAQALTDRGLIVVTRALVGVGEPSVGCDVRDLARRGVDPEDPDHGGITATSEEFPLTTGACVADTLRPRPNTGSSGA